MSDAPPSARDRAIAHMELQRIIKDGEVLSPYEKDLIGKGTRNLAIYVLCPIALRRQGEILLQIGHELQVISRMRGSTADVAKAATQACFNANSRLKTIRDRIKGPISRR